MQEIIRGLVQFQKQDFEAHKDLFKELGRKQNPHTLFIGCSDSRVVPSLITNSRPGDLFIIRNIANIVPIYRKTEEYVSTTSAIEYAVEVLNVKNIIVCGHSNCGGCAGLYKKPSFFEKLPHTHKWLELAEKIKNNVIEQVPEDDPGAREWLTEQINVVEQLKHLLTYPFIKERYEAGQITISGLYYIIETGEIYRYDKSRGLFELIDENMENNSGSI